MEGKTLSFDGRSYTITGYMAEDEIARRYPRTHANGTVEVMELRGKRGAVLYCEKRSHRFGDYYMVMSLRGARAVNVPAGQVTISGGAR